MNNENDNFLFTNYDSLMGKMKKLNDYEVDILKNRADLMNQLEEVRKKYHDSLIDDDVDSIDYKKTIMELNKKLDEVREEQKEISDLKKLIKNRPDLIKLKDNI